MAGLNTTGFTPLTYDEIKSYIETRLEQYNPGFDFSPESPDGQLISIFGVLLSQAWTGLENVYHSYNPNINTGQALRNIGMITGLYKGSATRSQAVVQLTGTLNTIVPKGSIFTDADGNEFYTNKDAYLPASPDTAEATVLAVESGPIPIDAGTITTIKSSISGLDSVAQADDGDIGSAPQTETEYRNLRNKTVMKGSNSVQESMSGAIHMLGIQQVSIINNDTNTDFITIDATPARSIQVVVGEFEGVSDDAIANAIFENKGLGTPTYGSTTTTVQDLHGYDHDVSFTKAAESPIYVKINVTYHTTETAGVDEAIKASVADYINTLLVGDDVVWSRLFGKITPFGEAEVTLLEIGLSAGTTAASNVSIDDAHYASSLTANIDLTSVEA